MQIRSTQFTIYQQVKNGMSSSFQKLIMAQRQVATGKRILAPSDDPVGTALAVSLRRQLADAERMMNTISKVRPHVQIATTTLEDAGGVLSEARALVIQGLNGTLNDSDRSTIAIQLDQLRQSLIELSNAKSGTAHLFGGTAVDTPPYVETTVDGRSTVVYQGNEDPRRARVGFGVDMTINVPGSQIFGKLEPLGASIVGNTGAALGSTANQGQGFVELEIRHDATSGSLAPGVAFVGGGSQDTFLGDRTLVVDGAGGTVQFGNGQLVDIPSAGDPDLADFVVRDEHGAELHLDFTGYAGADLTTTLTGTGSVSIDGGTSFVPLDFAATDLELIDSAGGTVLHLDTTGIVRSGTDMVSFSGAVDVFQVLQGMIDDLRNVGGIDLDQLNDQLGERLSELERHHENILAGLGTLGARLERLNDSEGRLLDVDLHLAGRLSDVEDADIASVILELSQSEQSLQLAQATGARLIQNSLLNFLR